MGLSNLNPFLKQLPKCFKIIKERIEFRRKYFPNTTQLRFPLVSIGEKSRVVRWLSEDEILNINLVKKLVKKHNIVSIDSTLLPNEFVIEIDPPEGEINYKLDEILKDFLLNYAKVEYVKIFSGGKSFHYHIYLHPKYEKLFEVIKKVILRKLQNSFVGIDSFGFVTSHPYRVPYSYHPKTMNMCIIVEKSSTNIEEGESIIISKAINEEIIKQAYTMYSKKLNSKAIDVLSIISGKQESTNCIKTQTKQNLFRNKLYNLYKTLLNCYVSDGRNRVACILFTLASYLDIPPTSFEKDFIEWATKCGWKEYRYRWFISAYKVRKKYYWNKNFWWSIKSFIYSNDISENDYNKVKNILKQYFPDYISKLHGSKT